MIVIAQSLRRMRTEKLYVGESARDVGEQTAGETTVIRSSRVLPTTSVRNLGAWFESELIMNTHVNIVCGSVYFHLFNIKRICKYLSKETTEKLVEAFFSSRIDYCNSLLYGLPVKQLDKMPRVQNNAARIMFLLPKFCHTHYFCTSRSALVTC